MARRLIPVGALLALAFLACISPAAAAETSNLLIQLQPGGGFRVWHAEGASVLDDDEVIQLDANAEPGGGGIMVTGLGPARARRTPLGVIIELQQATSDASLLVDRDACGHLKTWHADGETRLSEEQVTDLFMSALPGGGPRQVLDDGRHAKGFSTELGVMVTIWRPRPARR